MNIGGVTEDLPISLVGPACCNKTVTIPLGSSTFNRVMSAMERVDRLSTILGPNEKITAMVRLSLCLQQDQVNMKEVDKLNIPFDRDGQFIILHLKGVIDGGASDTIVTESKLGSIITDVGRKTSILSVLDESKRYKARKIRGFLKTGKTEILIVETISKTKNNIK